ncbi:MAG: ring,2-phenylacetyl-CoA epoxidase subunit PaaC [Nocardioidaceae bacterium]|nr:ring,2-phenylacetyl-CoA epoxidase subunit PaaC [Nocardioidaceae bacterium]
MPEADEYDAYAGLVEAGDETRWAFGTGFDDPLAGVDASVPPGVDPGALAAYCLMLGDDALVLSQRLVQWCTRAPELEEEVALANVALDLLGQARLLYARAAASDPSVLPALPDDSPVPAEDRLAFFREPEDFRCVTLVELPDGDFAAAVVRLLVFAVWRRAILEGLRRSVDPVLAAVGEKGVKEVAYHGDFAARWVLTLAGGTPESRQRTEAALRDVGAHLDELGLGDPDTRVLVAAGVAPDPAEVWGDAARQLAGVLVEAGLERPAGGASVLSGRVGRHSPWLPDLLAELQGLARAHPEGRW